MEKKQYNLSEQLDHIAYMFNVRTNGKAYENFIVNAIYTKIGNPNLVPVTQQYVINVRDPRRYYLLDLYFPQINYGVEIDERHHLEQQEKDEIRADDIKNAIQCDEGRITIYTNNDEKRSYADICADIESIVDIIRQKIADRGEELRWETNNDRKKAVVSLGRFHVDDDVSFDTVTEIYNICGGKRTGREKGHPADMLQRCYYRLTDKYKLWVPTLAIQLEDKGKNGFKNFLSEDHEMITENTNTPWKDPNKDNSYKRVVFMRMKNRFGKPCIKFIGVFESSSGPGDNRRVHYYKRIAKEIQIEELKQF